MYTFFLQLHHYLSWLLLLVIIFVAIRAWIGYLSGSKFTAADNISGLVLTIATDVQVLAGLILYLFLSPLTKIAFADFGAAMKNEMLRFYAVEHILVMIIAMIVIHIGRKRAKNASSDKSKHKLSALFYTAGLLIILSRIPWEKIF
jgi:hypothetical protein